MKRVLTAALFGTTCLVPLAALAQTGAPPAPQPNVQTAPQTGAQTPGQAAGQRGMTVEAIRNQALYNEQGQEFGRISNAVRDEQNRIHVIVTAGGREVLVPVERLRRVNNRYTMTGYTPQQLTALPTYTANMAGYRMVQPTEALVIAGVEGQRQSQADGQSGQIVVTPTAPSIAVQTPPAQVTVQQQSPQVTVQQPNPEILVRQPAPSVSVNIPQPEIIVRMPRPDVNVTQAAPQVEVVQPRPQVQVGQGAAPQVQMERAEAQVQVQRGVPQVSIAGAAEPQVRYEAAEPQVSVNQAQGQPVVRFERLDRTPQQRSAYQQQFGAYEETTGAVQPGAGAPRANMRAVVVSDLEGRDVYNLRGENLGEVEDVVLGANQQPVVVMSHGGFLGLGEDRVAIPLERFGWSGDRLVLQGVTEADLDNMDDYALRSGNYSTATPDYRAELRVIQ